jgi:hypothetical protein
MTAVYVILTISGLLSLAWIVLTSIQTARRRGDIERDAYLGGLEGGPEDDDASAGGEA